MTIGHPTETDAVFFSLAEYYLSRVGVDALFKRFRRKCDQFGHIPVEGKVDPLGPLLTEVGR